MKIGTDNSEDKFFRFLLATVNVYPDDGNGRLSRRRRLYRLMYPIWLGCCYILSLIGQTMYFSRSSPFQETMYTLLCILEQMFMALNTVYFEVGKKRFERMIAADNSRYSFRRHANPSLTVSSSDRRIQRVLLTVNFVFLYVCYSLHIVVPLIVFLIREYNRTVTITTVNETGPDYSNYLAVPFWFPYRIDSFTRLVLSSLIELFVFVPFVIYNFGAWLFVVYFVMEIRLQKDVLKRAVSSVDKIPSFDGPTANFNEKYRTLLSCYSHYISIARFAKDLAYCYRWFFQSFVLCSSVVLPILGYLIIVEVKNISLALRFLVHALVFIPHLYLFCFIGHNFTNLKTEFQYGIYANINWYRYPLVFQKTLLIMLASTQNEVRLKYGVKYIASFELFANILKSSYSYTNLLLKVN